jgi:kynurenine formamidase
MWKRVQTRRGQLALFAALTLGLVGVAGSVSAQPAPSPGSLAEAYRIIASRQFVDLTHAFSPASPVWRGFGPAIMSAAADPRTHEPYTIARHGFRATVYSMVGQYGTHIDPPAHFDPDGLTMDRIPVNQMILPLVVIDMTPLLGRDPNHALTVTDIEAWEAQHGQVPAGSFVALRTDMYRDFAENPERFRRTPFPAWSLAAIRFLYEQRGVVATGHEALDTDTTDSMESEAWLLRNGHWQIEVMANLDKVPATGALIVAAWPKVENGFGFPARVFAILP